MRILRVVGLILSLILVSASLRAHFVWVTLEAKDGKDPQAHIYFSESARPDSAQFLDGLTRLKVWHRTAEGNTPRSASTRSRRTTAAYSPANCPPSWAPLKRTVCMVSSPW